MLLLVLTWKSMGTMHKGHGVCILLVMYFICIYMIDRSILFAAIESSSTSLIWMKCDNR